jgi:hypothetical protein
MLLNILKIILKKLDFSFKEFTILHSILIFVLINKRNEESSNE